MHGCRGRGDRERIAPDLRNGRRPRTRPRHRHAPRRGRLLRLGVWLGTAVLAGCGGGSDAPRWIDLAADFEARPLTELAGEWVGAGEESARVRPHDELGQVWIETDLARDAWTAGPEPGTWRTTRPSTGAFARFPPIQVRLAAGERVFSRLPVEGRPPELELADGELRLRLSPSEALPDAMTYGLRVGQGAALDGTWRMQSAERVGDGIPVWSGTPVTRVVDIPRRSTLRFLTSWTGGGDASEPARLEVRIDGDVVFETEGSERERYHEVELPRSGRTGARITFAAEGPPGLASFHVPRIGPTERGTYPARPWGERRPDVVLFLADTFRADNLTIYGGKGLTPRLDAYAGDAVRFLNARSPSSWTLPSISSLLTGVAPGQHGATEEDLALSYDLTTLAEHFGDHGYRTGAITDAAFFTQAFGLDQGFQWFEQTSFPAWNLDATIASALEFLERDDGRPVFLVVHTYRVHAPYRRGPEEDASGWDELMQRGFALLEDDPGRGRKAQERAALALADEFRALYEEGVVELDRGFGRFLDGLREREVLDGGYLLFTSDHGEAFGENGDVWHGADLWDVKLRVPLLVSGPGLLARDVTTNVGLVDVAPTLSSIASLAPLSEWVGSSILDEARADTSLGYLLQRNRSQLVIVDGARKVFAQPDPDRLAAGEFELAFDLARDPGENEAVEGADWAPGLCRDHAAAIARQLVPAAAPDQLGAAANLRRNLEKIGYTGE